jgi:hypothetical protein
MAMRNPELRMDSPATADKLSRRFRRKIGALTSYHASVCIDAVKCLTLLFVIGLLAAANSCTTLVNRRDLYSPEPAPDSLEAARQWYGVTTTSTTTTRTTRPREQPLPPPDGRDY